MPMNFRICSFATREILGIGIGFLLCIWPDIIIAPFALGRQNFETLNNIGWQKAKIGNNVAGRFGLAASN